jgi:hypothetical protein
MGTSYDVEFVDGSCAALFGGCDSFSDFDFNFGNAGAPTQALLDQVFVGGFDIDYTLTLGCESNSLGACRVLIPVSPPTFMPQVQGIFFASVNSNTTSDPPFEELAFMSPFYDTSGVADQVFARFTLSPAPPAVPEPSTWSMMLLGFAAMGASLRRRLPKLRQLA